MSRNDTYLSLCLEQASLSSLHYRHGCIIVRGGKIIGKGYNDYRSGFNGGAQSTGKLGLHGPKQKNPQDHFPQPSEIKKKSAGAYVAFVGQDHAVGTGGDSLANTPLSMHSEMMAINSALSLSSVTDCRGTARSTQCTSKPTPTPSTKLPKSRPPRWSAVAGPTFNSLVLKPRNLNSMQHEQVDYYNVEDEDEEEAEQQQEKKQKKQKNNVSKRKNPGNNNVHHHAQINYLEFQKANAQKALRQLPSDDDEKHRKQYLYGTLDASQYHHQHSHHQTQHNSTHPPEQRHKTSAVIVPQTRIVTRSHQVAERMKDSRLNGADLYVARLGKAGKSNHFDCGCRYDTLPVAGKHASATSEDGDPQPQTSGMAPKTKLPTGYLHDELRFPSPPEKPKSTGKPASKGERLTATHSRPCYRCISYMHSAGIKRVFWTNMRGEWEGGKVRDLVDALESPVPPKSDGSVDAAAAVYVTKSEVLLLKGLK